MRPIGMGGERSASWHPPVFVGECYAYRRHQASTEAAISDRLPMPGSGTIVELQLHEHQVQTAAELGTDRR